MAENKERNGVHEDLFISGLLRDVKKPAGHVDIDHMQICRDCGEFMWVQEETRGLDKFKPTYILEKVARLLGVPGYLVHHNELDTIDLYRFVDGRREKRRMTPAQYVEWGNAKLDKHLETCPGKQDLKSSV